MTEEESLTIAAETSRDEPIGELLRPQSLDEYIGQTQVKANLRVFVEASKRRSQPLEHVLLYGPPGLGKTTLASIIARELGVNIRVTSGPAIERPGDIASILTNLQPNDVLFIDEIHRLSRPVEEMLYPALEAFALDLVLGKGPSAKTLRLDVPPFTLIGATTRAGSLSSPLRDRFGIIYHLEFYSDAEMTTIVKRSAKILGVEIDPDAAHTIAIRSRATPRIANRLIRRIRDFAEVLDKGVITTAVAKKSLDSLEIDERGLDELDRRLLVTIIEKFAGGPVGLETLAAAANEEAETVADVHEPFLLQQGFLQRTKQGRIATPLAYQHVGYPIPIK